MDEERFVAESRGSWDRLARAVETARKNGIARLDVTALRQMHYDYRRTAADQKCIRAAGNAGGQNPG